MTFTIAILISLAVPMYAQINMSGLKTGTTFLGFTGGIGISGVDHTSGSTAERTSFSAGITFIEIPQSHWGWGGQVALSSEGYKVNYSYTQTIKPLYLRVPVRAYYFFGKPSSRIRPNLYLGPSFAVKQGEYSSYNNNPYEGRNIDRNTNNFRTFEAGLNGGAGLAIHIVKSAWINADAGYYHGLTDALKDPEGTYNPNHNMYANLSLLFDIR